MKHKHNLMVWNARSTNTIIGLVGIVIILAAILVGIETTLSIVLLSIGTSILASSIVSCLTSRYLIQQSNTVQLIEQWGLEKIYEARAECNIDANEMLHSIKELEICAMGLKGLRDAQSTLIEKRVSDGMNVKILTIDPASKYLDDVDSTEGILSGATKESILSLIDWVTHLQKIQVRPNQVELKTYDHYPYGFYYCMDGTVFTGPYQAKTSQQTITYKYSANTYGAKYFIDYYNTLWNKAENVQK